MRCFLALFPDATSRSLLDAIAGGPPTGARRVPSENLHLTLAFLGDRSQEEIAAWRAALTRIRFDGARGRGIAWRWLPDARRARVGAVEVASDGSIEALAAEVRSRLGLEASDGFLPHVTLLRVRGATPTFAPTPVTVPLVFDRLGLYASDLRPEGSRYRPLAEVRA